MLERISVDPRICRNHAYIKGTRIHVHYFNYLRDMLHFSVIPKRQVEKALPFGLH